MEQEFVQLVHSETYGEASNGKKITAAENIGECLRIPGECPHVKKPMAPKTLFLASDPLSCLIPLIHDLKAQAFKESGQRVRSDGQVFLAGFVSFPFLMSKMSKSTKRAIEAREVYDQWVELNMAWLHLRYGRHLYAVTQHLDELYPHLHFHCPGFIENGRFTMGSLHAGQHAGKKAVADAVAANGGPIDGTLRKYIYNQAYKAAESELNDHYHEHVGKPLGMLRVCSESRPRLTRTQHLANRDIKEAAIERVRIAEEETARLRAELDRVNGLLAIKNLEFAAMGNARASDAHP